ncbi:ImmA/IrrE family metallo-endopeptidase [Streptosporangium sp. NPDC000239]|uniref:ImmA/IrrE family metallo-endopeptidase n=1 Tax=Streptosporangium sp. NPDC000239 TaxID=3154248 RepID=UPI00332A4DA2
MNWDVAHRLASIAAVQAHRDLRIDRDEYVDVHAALQEAGVVGMARPMPRLFGMYFSPQDNGPAVLLNANLDIVTQRHTAAHELGHHRLQHDTAFDKDLDRTARWGDGSWSDEEKTAEAFAAWFLMPPPAVRSALGRIGIDRPRLPEHAYQVARWLGTSYAGTVNHLHRLKLLTQAQKTAWLKAKPAAIKASLLRGLVSNKVHVHVIGMAAHGATVRVEVGDLVVLWDTNAHFEMLPDVLLSADNSEGQVLWGEGSSAVAAEVTDALRSTAVVTVRVPGAADLLEFTVARQSPRRGVQDLWSI